MEPKQIPVSRADGRRLVFVISMLMVFGGGLRLFVAWWVTPVFIYGDETYYVRVAENIAVGRGHVDPKDGSFAFRPPAHAYLLSLVADPETSGEKKKGRQTAGWRFLLLEISLSTLLIGTCLPF
jgi:hypothetical protein